MSFIQVTNHTGNRFFSKNRTDYQPQFIAYNVIENYYILPCLYVPTFNTYFRGITLTRSRIHGNFLKLKVRP